MDCIAVVVMEIDVDIKTIHLFVYYCVGDIDRKTDTIFLKLRRSGQEERRRSFHNSKEQ